MNSVRAPLGRARDFERLPECITLLKEAPCRRMFDLDGFKDINDAPGHLADDEILRHFAGHVAVRICSRSDTT